MEQTASSKVAFVPTSMAEISRNQTESSSSNKHGHIPLLARLIDSMVSIIIFGTGIYHLPQPNRAWRSGTIELFCAVLLLTAAYRVSLVKAVVMNLVVAGLFGGHSPSDSWRGVEVGGTELVFAVLLVTAANMVHRAGNNKKLSKNTSMTGQLELGQSD